MNIGWKAASQQDLENLAQRVKALEEDEAKRIGEFQRDLQDVISKYEALVAQVNRLQTQIEELKASPADKIW